MDVEHRRNQEKDQVADEAERRDVGDRGLGDMPRRQHLWSDHQPQSEHETDWQVRQTEKPDRKCAFHGLGSKPMHPPPLSYPIARRAARSNSRNGLVSAAQGTADSWILSRLLSIMPVETAKPADLASRS